jgi:outer membrane protein TolC
VKHPRLVRCTGPWLAASVLMIPMVLSAQTVPPTQESDWRRANDAVGAFKRGHADILKWEQANLPAEANQIASVQGMAVPTMDDAVRRAWRVHPSLARVQSRLGPQNVQIIETGRWVDLDPSLQRRVEDMDELLEVATQARKAWVDAVTARQILRHRQTSLEAAQAANELGKRMVTVGNWSRLQQSPVQLAEASARMDLRRAQLAAAQAQSSLIKLLGLAGLETSLVLPDRLPDVPATALTEAELQKSAAAIQGQLPNAEQLRNKALARSAINTYLAAHALALDSRDVVLKERVYITEETVLHYNGMLKSVWDLLDETRNQAQATADAISAQRDFWVAEADLQWVMQGGAPDSFVSLGGAAEAPAAAAH